MMQLKLLGVLQDYDSPYASLYRDDNSQNLYLAVEQDSDKPKEFCTLLLHVSKYIDIDDDMFDPDFCNHEASIKYYLNK